MSLALASLLNLESVASDRNRASLQGGTATEIPHHPAKAKRVIVFWQGGGPSHVDLFDEKPKLQEMVGQDVSSYDSGQYPFVDDVFGLFQMALRAVNQAAPYLWAMRECALSEMLPTVGSIADELCLVRSFAQPKQSITHPVLRSS